MSDWRLGSGTRGFPPSSAAAACRSVRAAAEGAGGRGGIGTGTLTCPSDAVDGWTDRWTESKHKSDFGKFVLSAGKFYGDLEKDKGKSLELGAEMQEDLPEEALVTDGPGIPRSRAGRGRGMAVCVFDS